MAYSKETIDKMILSFEKALDSIDRGKHGRYSVFLCHIVDNDYALRFMKREKPTKNKHVEFYNHEAYAKGYFTYSWWTFHSLDSHPEIDIKVLDEKSRFIQKLIDKLKSYKNA